MSVLFEKVPFVAPMQASKWLRLQLLIDPEEMEELFKALGNPYLFITWRVCLAGEGEVPLSNFLAAYRDYVAHLKKGELLDEAHYSGLFSSTVSSSSDCMVAVPLSEERFLLRPFRPVIQMQPYTLGYSSIDQTFRSMMLGGGAMSWGIQFSYPQLFQEPETKEVVKVGGDRIHFPNTDLFRTLQLWVRRQTRPVSFVVDGKKHTLPQRIGKKAASWVDCHPQLATQQITVK